MQSRNLDQSNFIVGGATHLELKPKWKRLDSALRFVQIAGNPDQQEDNLDEQYQEEGDDEVTKQHKHTLT